MAIAEIRHAIPAVETTASSGLLGEHRIMRDLRARLACYANLAHPVLLEGESGTGKEIAACHHLHRLSRRHAAPLLILNCSAMAPSLIEASLFGHVRGAFTGAIRDRAGYFGEAGKGTLFLDEVAELPLELQGKLLRVLENGEYQRLGETRSRFAEARILAATHRDLPTEIREGRFRADLYHRLSVLTVRLPPLRDRGNDRQLLLEYFRQKFANNGGGTSFRMTEAAQRRWAAYDFPGNVRELRNVVARLSAHHMGETVDDEALSEALGNARHSPSPANNFDASPEEAQQIARHILHTAKSIDLDARLAVLEQGYIRAALEIAQGNLSRAARQLGLNRTTLYNRIQSWQRR